MGILKNTLTNSFILVVILLQAGCATNITKPDDICAIFLTNEDWYQASKDSYQKWGTPIYIQMAIIHQESRFRHDAQPERESLLGVIPWFRPSSAYGYAQALDNTWRWYQQKTNNPDARRDDFEDVTDFIGWYSHQSHRLAGISKWNAHDQYLAYHEGQKGFRQKSYLKKQWLRKVAHKVERQALRYKKQLTSCENELESSSIWAFF